MEGAENPLSVSCAILGAKEPPAAAVLAHAIAAVVEVWNGDVSFTGSAVACAMACNQINRYAGIAIVLPGSLVYPPTHDAIAIWKMVFASAVLVGCPMVASAALIVLNGALIDPFGVAAVEPPST